MTRLVHLAAVLLLPGCATAMAHDHLAASTAASPSTQQKHFAHGTGHLQITLVPTTGGVGTKVRITATGCGDTDGGNHAASFNPGFANTLQAAQAHYRLHAIASQITGQTLTATYTITAEDAAAASNAGGPPRFYVQCSDDTADSRFRITH